MSDGLRMAICQQTFLYGTGNANQNFGKGFFVQEGTKSAVKKV
jgi:hypothetical protein